MRTHEKVRWSSKFFRNFDLNGFAENLIFFPTAQDKSDSKHKTCFTKCHLIENFSRTILLIPSYHAVLFFLLISNVNCKRILEDFLRHSVNALDCTSSQKGTLKGYHTKDKQKNSWTNSHLVRFSLSVSGVSYETADEYTTKTDITYSWTSLVWVSE